MGRHISLAPMYCTCWLNARLLGPSDEEDGVVVVSEVMLRGYPCMRRDIVSQGSTAGVRSWQRASRGLPQHQVCTFVVIQPVFRPAPRTG